MGAWVDDAAAREAGGASDVARWEARGGRRVAALAWRVVLDGAGAGGRARKEEGGDVNEWLTDGSHG